MLEMQIKIDAPELSAALTKLAEALNTTGITQLTPAKDAAQAPASAPVEPVIPAPAPVAPPAPAPIAAPTPAPAPVAASAAPVAGQTAAPGNSAAPAVPVTTAPSYSLDQIANAGAALVNIGKMEQLLALLAKYGVQAVTQLQPAQYGTFVTELRALGAQI